MGNKEEFEAYCLDRNIDPKSLWGLCIADGWNARQPELDAKDKVIDDLALQKGILKAEVGRLESELTASNANLEEVERLRKVAEETAQYLEGLTGWPRLHRLGKNLRAELNKDKSC